MTGSTGHTAMESRSTDPRRANRLAIASLLMLPANLPWMLVAYAIGTAGMALVGAQEGHLLTEYGPWGWVAWLIMLAVTDVPSIVGVVLGVKARNRGAGSQATGGIALNALVGIGWVVLSAAQVAI